MSGVPQQHCAAAAAPPGGCGCEITVLITDAAARFSWFSQTTILGRYFILLMLPWPISCYLPASTAARCAQRGKKRTAPQTAQLLVVAAVTGGLGFRVEVVAVADARPRTATHVARIYLGKAVCRHL